MKEAIVYPGPRVEIKDSPIPEPGPTDVVIKVAVSGSNPKDWKYPHKNNNPHNSGDDIAGVVHTVGSDVYDFRPGDRVAAFHRMGQPGGSFAEYAVAPAHTTFRIPRRTSYEEAATVPLAAMTAAVGLFARMGLPEPWGRGREDGVVAAKEEGKHAQPGPLVVYGAAGAVGAFAVKLAKRAGVGPIICVAGRGVGFVETLLDKSQGDAVVDYRDGDEAVVKGIRDALKGQKLWYAYDAVSENGSYANICKILEPQGGSMACILPVKEQGPGKAVPEGVNRLQTMVGVVHEKQTDFGNAWFTLFGKGLLEGWLKGHPHEVVPGGLNGVEQGLKNLMDGKASAVKYVFRIPETEGAEKGSGL